MKRRDFIKAGSAVAGLSFLGMGNMLTAEEEVWSRFTKKSVVWV